MAGPEACAQILVELHGGGKVKALTLRPDTLIAKAPCAGLVLEIQGRIQMGTGLTNGHTG